ncbi:MAG: ADP-glyceromanno-heptose 6-epimerase [Campylobacteraceae bacterium]|nr:ADP-glyceromanno-heptose 6-epimerase [Campylobacteraceae bacterium]
MKYINSKLRNKTVLITGAAGFIGSNLAFYFQENHPEVHVIAFDIFRTGERFENGNLKSFGHFKNLTGFKGEIISGDITKKEDLARLENYDINYIFHEAAISDTTVSDQEIMIKTNVNAFIDLLELAKRKDARMIYASSGATYGSTPSPQTVGIENPQNVYGFSKLAMDNIAAEYARKYSMFIIGLRYFNVYGKNEYFKEKTASMVLQLGLQILSGKMPRLFFNSDKILRDFIYIEDVIQANILSMVADKSGVYNVGTGKPRSFQDIADILQKGLETDYKINYFENPYKAYQMHTQADIASTREEIGFDPKFSLEKGIKDYLPEIKRVYEGEVKNV